MRAHINPTHFSAVEAYIVWEVAREFRGKPKIAEELPSIFEVQDAIGPKCLPVSTWTQTGAPGRATCTAYRTALRLSFLGVAKTEYLAYLKELQRTSHTQTSYAALVDAHYATTTAAMEHVKLDKTYPTMRYIRAAARHIEAPKPHPMIRHSELQNALTCCLFGWVVVVVTLIAIMFHMAATRLSRL